MDASPHPDAVYCILQNDFHFFFVPLASSKVPSLSASTSNATRPFESELSWLSLLFRFKKTQKSFGFLLTYSYLCQLYEPRS